MGDIPVYLQFILVIFSIVGNLASTVLAGIWLMAYRSRKNEVNAIRTDVRRITDHLIAEGIIRPSP